VDRDIDPVHRVERAKDEERERREQAERRQQQSGQGAGGSGQEEPPPEGPVEGDDGHLHIDIRA
jgi:hypothetical protein